MERTTNEKLNQKDADEEIDMYTKNLETQEETAGTEIKETIYVQKKNL